MSSRQIERLRLVIDLSVQAEQRAVEALGLAEAARREAEDRLIAWYRSPAFWVAIGAFVSAALMAVATIGLSALAK